MTDQFIEFWCSAWAILKLHHGESAVQQPVDSGIKTACWPRSSTSGGRTLLPMPNPSTFQQQQLPSRQQGHEIPIKRHQGFPARKHRGGDPAIADGISHQLMLTA